MYWRNYVTAREGRLAAESDPLKHAGVAQVGLDQLLPTAAPDDLSALLRYVATALVDPDRYFTAAAPIEFHRSGERVTFQASLTADRSPGDAAEAAFYPARSFARAVVLLHHWNAQAADYRMLGRMLAHCGISCLQLSLPYHDKRQTPGVGFARELVSENLGLTISANRQAIVEARAALSWLQEQGYQSLGLVGVSIGSSIGSIVAALDHRLRAAALLLMADDFAEVVWSGSATRHVRRSLEARFKLEDVRSAWALISPSTYAARLSRRIKNLLIVSGRIDGVFVPELTQRYVDRLKESGLSPTWMQLNCGHYTLAMPPYSLIAFARTVSYLRRTLG